jgi:PhoPQ-activated pathogenicity-related protein
MEGEKHLRYVANAKHDMAGSDSRETRLAYLLSVIEGKKRPVFTWKKPDGQTIVVTPKDAPAKVLLWQAANQKARDFRVDNDRQGILKHAAEEKVRWHLCWKGRETCRRVYGVLCRACLPRIREVP